jgi:hypothetical protein
VDQGNGVKSLLRLRVRRAHLRSKFALKETWQRREGDRLTADAYTEVAQHLLSRVSCGSQISGGQYGREDLTRTCHHPLRQPWLPTGIPGVKANLVFFEKKEGRAEA